MKAALLDWHRPEDRLLRRRRVGMLSVCDVGGQSPVPMPAGARPDRWSIRALQELRSLPTPDTIRIGALTTHAAIEDGKLPDGFNGPRQVASGISYRAVAITAPSAAA
jgi:carbon-monoxide dehydrogenase medium subunit